MVVSLNFRRTWHRRRRLRTCRAWRTGLRSSAQCTMCPKHMSTHLSKRFQFKCAVTDCLRLGHREHRGLRFCSHHEETTRQSSRRTSRSRSRTRDRGDEEPQESEKDEGLRIFDPFGGSRYIETYSSTRHNRGLVPGGNRSAAGCLCPVLRRALPLLDEIA